MGKYLFMRSLLQRCAKASGFTLIELLVVMIILGILAAIALPAFIGQVQKSRQAEAKVYMSTINRLQRSYYLEHLRYSPTIEQLGAGISANTNHYNYSIAVSTGATVTDNFTTSSAVPTSPELVGYTGMLQIVPTAPAVLHLDVICRMLNAGAMVILPTSTLTGPVCGAGSEVLTE